VALLNVTDDIVLPPIRWNARPTLLQREVSKSLDARSRLDAPLIGRCAPPNARPTLLQREVSKSLDARSRLDAPLIGRCAPPIPLTVDGTLELYFNAKADQLLFYRKIRKL